MSSYVPGVSGTSAGGYGWNERSRLACYEITSPESPPRYVWAIWSTAGLHDLRLLWSEGRTYLTWSPGPWVGFADVTSPRSRDEALRLFVAGFPDTRYGGPPASEGLILVASPNTVIPYDWLTVSLGALPARPLVHSVKRTGPSSYSVTISSGLHVVKRTFEGSGSTWRETWLSRYQVPLAGGFLALIALATALWVARRKRRPF